MIEAVTVEAMPVQAMNYLGHNPGGSQQDKLFRGHRLRCSSAERCVTSYTGHDYMGHHYVGRGSPPRPQTNVGPRTTAAHASSRSGSADARTGHDSCRLKSCGSQSAAGGFVPRGRCTYVGSDSLYGNALCSYDLCRYTNRGIPYHVVVVVAYIVSP